MKEVQIDMPLITITVTGDVPQESADIANAIADHYKAMRDRQDEQSYSDEIAQLKQVVVDQQRDLDSSENRAFENPVNPNPRHAHDAEKMVEWGKAGVQQANAELQRAIDSHQHGHQSAVQIISRATP
jgi:hypothetical protein